MKLNGKVAVVIGGTGGIGAATVRLLSEAGAAVVIAYHRGERRAKALLDDLPGEGHSALPMALDDSASIGRLCEEVKQLYGRTDILINAAGFTEPIAHANLEALTDEIFDSILVANVRGPFAAIRAFAPLLHASGDGVIVNVSSISAFTGSGSNIAYCASKAALDTMTLSLARTLGPAVRVLGVSPGAVATDFVAGRDRSTLERIAQSTPLQRVVEPQDVAAAIMVCVTHLRASTGATIIVDGGRFLV